ncbi:MAG: hypothetical protein PHS09_03795, partial [Candidatus Omnitrophica bacterium]|nr:hypothetical protein [Candidatus Omnitrophota bacterium]
MKELIKGQGEVMKSENHRFGFCTKMLSLFLVFAFFLQMSNLGYVLAEDGYDPYGAEPGGAQWYQENAGAIANGEFSQLPTPSATASSYIPNLVDFTNGYNAAGGTDSGFNSQINNMFGSSANFATAGAGATFATDAVYNDPYGAEPGGALWYQENASAIANGEFSQLPTPSETASSYIPNLVDFTSSYNAMGGTDMGFNNQINDLFATGNQINALAGNDLTGGASFFNIAPETTPHLESPDLATILAQSEDISAGRDTLGRDLLGVPADADAVYNDPYGAEPGGALWYQENASAIANGEFSQLPTPSATASSYIPGLVDFTTGYNASGGTDPGFNSQINLFATPLELKPLDDIIGPALINPATGQDIITSAANSSKGLEYTTPLNTTSVTVPKIEGPALFDLKTGQYVTDSAETIKGPDLAAPANAPRSVTPDTTGQRGYAYMDTNTVFNESVDTTSDFYEYAQQDIKEAYNDKSNIFHTDVVEMINQVNADPVKVRKAADEIIGRAQKYYDQSGRGPWQDAARMKLNPGKNYSNSPLLNNPLTADVNSAVAAEILNRANTAPDLLVPKFEMPDIDVPIVEAALLTEPPKVITGAGLEDVVGAPGPDNQIPEVDPAKIQLPAGPTPVPAIQDAGAIAEEILGGAAKGAVIEPPKLPELKPRDVEIPRQAVEPPALNSPREGLGLPEILNPTPGPAADLQRQPAEPPNPPHIVGDAGQIAAQVLGAGPQIQPVLPTPVRNTDETVGRLLPQTTPVPTIPRADLSPRLGAMAITDGTELGGAMTPAQARFQAKMAARQFATGVHMQAAQPTYSYGSSSGSQVQYNSGELSTAVQG